MTSLVQSAIISYLLLTVGASVGEREVFDWAKNFFQTYPCDRILFSISFCGVCKIKTINSMQEFLFESTLFAHK